MKTRNWLLTICFLLPVLLLVGVLTVAPPERVAVALQPQATIEPSPRYGHTMVTISDTVYLFGGTNITPTQGILSGPLRPAGDLYNDIWAYREPTGWEKIESSGTVPSPRHSHAATTLGGLMYVYGGTDGTTVFNDMWEYDPATNEWTQKLWTGPYNAPDRYEGTLTGGGVGSDYLYLYGGRRPGGYICSVFYRYNVNTGEASSMWVPNGPDARAGHSAVEYDGKIYLFGGIGGEPPTYKNDLWVYDPLFGKWTKLEPLGDLRYGLPPERAYATMVATRISATARISLVVIGGRNSYGDADPIDLWSYIPERNVWECCKGCGHPNGRAHFAGGTLVRPDAYRDVLRTAQAGSDAILIFGGLHNGVPIAETVILNYPFLRHLYLPLVTR